MAVGVMMSSPEKELAPGIELNYLLSKIKKAPYGAFYLPILHYQPTSYHTP